MFKLTMRNCVALFFFTVAVHAVASAPMQVAEEGQLLLFMPEIQGGLPYGLSYTVHKPYSELKPAISPTKPWETYAVFAYNSVVQYGPGEFRIYYDCIEGGGAPPGRRLGSKLKDTNAVFRRICLATSSDGLSWAKPELNVYNRNGSTANNILLEDSGVSVFLDGNPKEPDSRRWKMITSYYAYHSPDGIHWTNYTMKKTISSDDTKPTAYWVNSLQKYVIYTRNDVGPDYTRYIGRCETDDITNWLENGNCTSVFGPDKHDPATADIYTNAWSPYPSPNDPVVHLFFPSVYSKLIGLLDIRFVYTKHIRDDLTYPAGDRRPFVSLGMNGCGLGHQSPYVSGGWCPQFGNEELQNTAFDTSAMYMASGHVLSPNGHEVYFYSSGQPFLHSQGRKVAWGSNTGIRVNRIRRDGFVSIDAGYHFNVPLSEVPQFVAKETLYVPTSCDGEVRLRVNFKTSVVGYVLVGLEYADAGKGEVPLVGYGLWDANKLVGNAVKAAALWRGNITTITELAGMTVLVRVAMVDATLFSLNMVCDPPS
jgi:hypothetical protein